MTEQITDLLGDLERPRDPALAWVAIQEAAREHHEAELAEIAFLLYGQLGEARAEADRLRACLRASLRGLTPTGLDGWR